MTCPRCGTPAVAGARFCFACGAPLAGDAPEAPRERRRVTVLFGDLSDFTSWAEDLDPERVGGVTDRVLATLAEAVTQFGGHVDKLTGDGLMAVFGAPVAHEDDPERAVRAAARMQGAVRRVVEEEGGGGRRLGLRVGLNTGEVLAGLQASVSYTVVGDAVNTAARLSDAAGVDAVYAGRETALATAAVASWRALAPLRLKGKREPVPAYELVGLRPPGATRLGLGDEAPFVGRDAELGLLIGRLLEVADRQTPRAVLLTGEAGVGKTRLAEEVGRFAGELPEARVLVGRCAPFGEGRDLAAVAEMVRVACGVGSEDDGATARSRVARRVGRLPGPVPAGTAEGLLRLLGLAEDDAGPREGATPGPGAGGDLVRRAVAALFRGLAAEGPLLLVLDDLNWATPRVIEGLLQIASGASGPVLLLALGRPEMLEIGPAGWWERLPEAELLPVLPLEAAAAERLLRAYLGTAEVDPGVRDALLSRAEGNPFFLAELLHLLVDRGVLQREGQRWLLAGELPAEVPAGVRSVLAARIDGLDGRAKGVLRDAAVLGQRVTLDGLVAVGRASGHGDPASVRAAVDALVDRRLLEADADEGVYRFGHTLVRDVAYAGLAKAERARRHAAAVRHVQRAGGRSTEADGVVATHAERAVHLATEMSLPASDPAWQARGPGFTALARLGHAALVRGEHRGAERLLARAFALDAAGPADPLPDDLTQPVHVDRAAALAGVHRLQEAEAELAGVLSTGENGTRAGALVVLGEVRRRGGDSEGATRAFVSALAGASSAGLDTISSEALRQLGLLDYFDGRLRAAEGRFQEGYELARQVGDERGAAWSLQHLAWSATTRGDYLLADRTLDRAAEVFGRVEDTAGLAWVAGTEGFVRLLQGRLADARELAGSVLPVAEVMGEQWGVAALLTIDALAAAELGEVEEARDAADRACQSFAELGDAWGHGLATVAAGVAARGAGEGRQAASLFEQASRLSASYPLTHSLALVAAGWTHLDADDVASAGRCCEEAAQVLAGLELEPHAALGAAVLQAQVRRAQGDPAGALAQLDAALAVAREPALLFPRRQALAHRAELLLELGRVSEALAAAQLAAATPAEDVRSQVLAQQVLAAARRAVGDG